jgi:hypothetical protein
MVNFEIDPPIDDALLNDLFARAWPEHMPAAYQAVLARSLGYLGAFAGDQLIGFVNLATDGGQHAFLLDPTVDRQYSRRGIGLELVRRSGLGPQPRLQVAARRLRAGTGAFLPGRGFSG